MRPLFSAMLGDWVFETRYLTVTEVIVVWPGLVVTAFTYARPPSSPFLGLHEQDYLLQTTETPLLWC